MAAAYCTRQERKKSPKRHGWAGSCGWLGCEISQENGKRQAGSLAGVVFAAYVGAVGRDRARRSPRQTTAIGPPASLANTASHAPGPGDSSSGARSCRRSSPRYPTTATPSATAKRPPGATGPTQPSLRAGDAREVAARLCGLPASPRDPRVHDGRPGASAAAMRLLGAIRVARARRSLCAARRGRAGPRSRAGRCQARERRERFRSTAR